MAKADTLPSPGTASIVRKTGITPASFWNGHSAGTLNSVDLPRNRGYGRSVAIRSRPSTNPLL